ncbi:MAG: hypothetical protein ACRDK7_05665 [Solirubrobacteraceae bacterium]
MAITTRVLQHVHSGAGPRAGALLLPADPRKPIRGLTVEGLDDVRAAVGGQIEGFAYPSDPSVWGYASAIGKCVPGGEPNARATSLLDPDGPWISGDVVLVAFDDDHRQQRDLPARFGALIDEPAVLGEPTLSARGNAAAFHAWEISRDERGGRVMAVLTITLCPALEEPIGLAEEYTAMLSTRSERSDLFGSRLCCDGPRTAFCVRRERGVAVCRNNTCRFAALALATVNALYAVGDERVLAHFTRPGRTHPPVD